MSILTASAEKVGNAHRLSEKDRKLAGIGIYTLLFALGYVFLIMPVIRETGTIMAGDGAAQFYPFLLQLRSSLIEFADNISKGVFEFPSVLPAGFIAGDTIVNCICFYLPLLPIYALSVFVPVGMIAGFYAGAIIFEMYCAGLSFIIMSRHFRLDPIYSGVFAAIYTFCGSMSFSGMWYPHFIYMYIAFPFMVIGIEKIIHGGSGLSLTLSCAWLGLAGVNLLVYTLPFAGLYAVIRLIQVRRKDGAAVCVKILAFGIFRVIVGVAAAGIILIPYLAALAESGRKLGIAGISLSELFIPSLGHLSEMLGSESCCLLGTTVCAAAVPPFLYTLFSAKVKPAYRCLSLVLMLTVSSPLVWYGVNGFMYELCRWGFVPALYMCGLSVRLLPDIVKAEMREKVRFIVCLLVFLLFFAAGIGTFGAAFALLIGIANIFPKTRDMISVPLDALSDRICAVLDKRAGKICAAVISVILAAIPITELVLLANGITAPVLSLTAAICLFAAAVLTVRITRASAQVLAVSLSAVFAVSAVGYFSDMIYIVDMPDQNSMYYDVASVNDGGDPLTRFQNLYIDSHIRTEYTGTDQTNDGSVSGSYKNFLGSIDNFMIYGDMHTNLIMRYGMPNTEGFYSMPDGDMYELMKRCGQDVYSLNNSGYFSGFSGKEPLYSLFGTKYFYTSSSMEKYALYGITGIGTKSSAGNGISNSTYTVKIYRNDYALPSGVTYPVAMPEEWYERMSPAALPYAMMNGVYLEGYAGGADNGESYSRVCGTEVSREVKQTDENGMEIASNTVKLQDDVSGCFLYLTLSGVKYISDSNSIEFSISADNERSIRSRIQSDSFLWKTGLETYCIALGYYENSPKELTFDSAFNFDTDNIKVEAIPENVFTDAYEQRTRETLENVKLATNSVSGDITVSSDCILSIDILHSSGWKAFVDEREVPVYKANGVFIGIPLDTGTHDIRLVYRTPGIAAGAAVSAAAVLIIIAAEIIHRKRHKNNSGT